MPLSGVDGLFNIISMFSAFISCSENHSILVIPVGFVWPTFE